MNFFEPFESAANANELDLQPVAFGTSVLKTLSKLTNERVDRMCRNGYVVTNAMFADKIMFPDWLINSRFWIPGVSLDADKPIVVFMPYDRENVPLHRKHYQTVQEYFCRPTDLVVSFFANTSTARWELHVKSPSIEVIFQSWRPVDIPFVPPLVQHASSTSQSPSPTQ